ncbi:T9SS type A sorting domain-containing protein [Abyssalbus ytuae]|uniref:T9SS type A sorting domain-containing protein n=1 Tax=Abyssalbus ytuae TaxID=2926907 RepID=A0A9E7A412_9FLAO|nr:T9SS type A sorting domain-containing protein [Abyssalbus ytuae]
MALTTNPNAYLDLSYNDPVLGFESLGVNSLNGNNEDTVTFSKFIGDNYLGLNFVNGQTYWLIVDVDYNNDVDESNESNSDNLWAFAFTYSSTSSKKLVLSKGQTLYISNNNIEIYDFSGNKVSTQKGSSPEEEKIIIDNLPKGYYIIKSGEKTTKIYND